MTDNFGLNSFNAPHPALPAIQLHAVEGQTADLIAFVDEDDAPIAAPWAASGDLSDYELIADLEADYTNTTDLNTALDLKADIADYTTTTDLNTALDLKLDIADGLTLADNVSTFVAQIADPSSATAEDVANKVNALLTALITAGLMAAS